MEQKIQIFISYRHGGGSDTAKRLHDSLKARGYIVFLDNEGLGSGDFDTALYDRISESVDVLSVLTPAALDRCFTDPEDWVKKEISRALELDKNIIPVMMENFIWPEAKIPDIDPLRKKNGARLFNDYYDAAVEKIISFLHSRPLNGVSSDELLIKYSLEGDTQAQNELGLRCEFGSETIDVDFRRAFSYYKQAAEKEDPGGLYNLGDIYDRCSRDLALVYDYDIETANSDPEAACREMREKAVNCYTRSAETGFPPAVYRLGNLAEEDNNPETAIKLYQEAADKGYPPAMNALGYYIINGIASKSDPQKAEELFKKAADRYAPAAYNYARILETRSAKEAINYYSRIAYGRNAIPEAAYALGKLYQSMNDKKNAANAFHQALYSGIAEAEKDLQNCWNQD